MNAVLERLRAQRAEQVTFVDQMLERVDADGGRDMVDAERANLKAAKERISELDEQIKPLEEYEASRGAQVAATVVYGGDRSGEGPRDAVPAGGGRRPLYTSPGAFIVDYVRANGLMSVGGQRIPADPDAAARIRYAVDNQTTADTPGLLPHPIVGGVVDLIDANRPLITSIGGGRSMGGIPGKTFGRPKVTQHTLAGVQVGEKTQLPSRRMKIEEVPFSKATYGGTVDVSRQDIDWTSPAAWDILIRDLANQYAKETEAASAADFVAKADDVNAPVAVADAGLAGWAAALYGAAAEVYAAAEVLPDRIWCSVDVWAQLGPIVDVARLVFPSSGAGLVPAGESNLDSFAGNMFQLPRIVVPKFPPGTMIIGQAAAYEVYEEVVGLLSAIEPAIFGVEVAYGGYVAFNAVAPEALCPITPPVVAPGARRATTPSAPADTTGYGGLTVAQLQEAAAARDLPTSGTKAELVDRLAAADAEA